MSNKKETPVSWLMEEYYDSEGRLWNYDFDKALQMEAKKQQKYDEMVAMLEVCKQATSSFDMHQDLEQLIKEAKNVGM
jgi:hypothetical protein